MQRTGGCLGSGYRSERMAAIGLSEGKPVIKLNRRKPMARDSKLVRVCICEQYAQDALELHAPQLSCPVCQMWPAIRQLAATGGQLFSGWAGKKISTELRSFGESRERHGAGRLGTHSCRRRAARAMLEAGGSFSQLLRAGQWRSSAYQLYLDLSSEDPQAVTSIWVEASGDE